MTFAVIDIDFNTMIFLSIHISSLIVHITVKHYMHFMRALVLWRKYDGNLEVIIFYTCVFCT